MRFPAGMEGPIVTKGRRPVVFMTRKIYLPPQPTKQTILHSRRESLAAAIYKTDDTPFP